MPTTGPPSGRRRTESAAKTAESAALRSTKKAGPAAKKAAAKKKPAAKKKAVVTKKPAAKRSTAKKAATRKKPAAKKPGERSAARKKSASTKAPAGKVAKKAAKKTPAKKAPAGKVAKKAAKKTPAKKSAKKAATKKKAPARQVAKKRAAKHKPTTITRRVSRKRPASRSRSTKPLIGWREWVVLPEFTETPIKAKVDSGAVTSSIHAFNLQISTDNGQTMARFGVAPKQGSHAAKTIVEHPVIAFKKVRSSNGQAELRPVIRTVAVIGDESFEIDITLASRDAMGFRMLLGRKAVRNRFVIDPGRSFLQPTTPDSGPPSDQSTK